MGAKILTDDVRRMPGDTKIKDLPKQAIIEMFGRTMTIAAQSSDAIKAIMFRIESAEELLDAGRMAEAKTVLAKLTAEYQDANK